jgi:eukaryotic-like serine/threonine-protein kinase
MFDANHCSECGTELMAKLPKGLCSRCALIGALQPPLTPGGTPHETEHVAHSEVPISKSAVEHRLDGRVPAGQLPGRAVPSGSWPTEPRRFGDYELLEEIARGGMGIVYKARQISLDRIVAVKLLLMGQYASEAFISRFRIEAMLAASLRHPHIVTIHEVGVHEGQHFFSMDFVDGPDLARLVRDQPLPARRVARYVKMIAEAIQFAHARHILHRDLKPSNVLIGANDEPRVTDFGLAKNLATDSDLTLSGQALGSPSFMPPEQALGDRGKIGPASDIYSMGAILYHGLTGRPPFVGQSMADTLHQVEDHEPMAPRLLVPGVPADLETICLRCLAKEPGKRFPTAQELADELDRFLRGEPILSRPVSDIERVWRWCQRKPVLALLGAVTALLLLALLIGGPIAFWRISLARDRAEQNLYVANIRLANEALTANNLVHARTLLNGIADSPQQRRLRGWEWQHLMSRCQTESSVVLGTHEAYVAAVALAPDERMAASLSGDGIVKVWNLDTLGLERSWTAHENPEQGKPTFTNLALEYSPGGDVIATGGRDRMVRIWEASSGRLSVELGGLSDTCRGLAFSADGRMLGAVDVFGWVCLWELAHGHPEDLHAWQAGRLLARHIAFSPDLLHLVVSGYEQPAVLWDISNPRQPRLERTLDGTHWIAAFSTDGQWLLAGGSSGHDLRRWELPDWNEHPAWPARSANLIALAFSADSQWAASGYANGEITLWDATGRQRPASFLGHVDYVTDLAFSRKGLTLASSSRDQTVRLWNVSRNDRFDVIGRGFATLAVCFSADSRYLASVEFIHADRSVTVNTEHSVTLWEVTATGLRELANRPVGGMHFSVYPAFSPDGKMLAVDDWQSGIQWFAVPSLAPIDQVPAPAFAPQFQRDGRALVYSDGSRWVRRDLAPPTRNSITMGGHAGKITRLALSPEGRTAACCVQEDGAQGIQLWDVINNRLLGIVQGHEASIYGLAFSPDGRWLASTSVDSKVGIWDVRRRTLHKWLQGHSGVLYSAAFSADGQRLAAAGEDGVLRLWDTVTWHEVGALHAHATLNTVSFSSDNRWLAAAAQDGTIRLWQAASIADIEARTGLANRP